MDPTGRTIVVTGGSSGVGEAAARALAARGARVVITGRSARTRAGAAEFGAEAYQVDYAHFAEVRAFADALLAGYPRIDVLVNNVGAVYTDRRTTPDGHEMTLQVNHLSAFLLTNLLRERLEASGAVVVNTSSAAHRFGRLDLRDLESERDYNGLRTYANTKVMNILHAMEIARRFRGVSAASFHPGAVASRFARETRGAMRWYYEGPLRHLFLISPAKGADTLLWLIQGTPGRDWQSGQYYAKRKVGARSRQATPENAAALWTASEQLLTESGA